jgi:hypothetical protein
VWGRFGDQVDIQGKCKENNYFSGVTRSVTSLMYLFSNGEQHLQTFTKFTLLVDVLGYIGKPSVTRSVTRFTCLFSKEKQHFNKLEKSRDPIRDPI